MSDHDPVAEALAEIACEPEMAVLVNSTWVRMADLFAAVRRAALKEAEAHAAALNHWYESDDIVYALRRLAEGEGK